MNSLKSSSFFKKVMDWIFVFIQAIIMIAGVIIVIAIASIPAIILFELIKHYQFGITVICVIMLILMERPVNFTIKLFGFRNFVRINRGKYPTPLEKPEKNQIENIP